MAVEAHPTPLTTQTEIDQIFSALGTLLRVDDDDDRVLSTAETEILDQAITEASDLAYQYLLHRYTDTVLETSRWVRRHVSYVACHILSRRLGNDSQFAEEYDAAIAEFINVMEGRIFIPRLSPDDNYEPSLSNHIVDYRYGRSKIRTDQETARGGVKGSVTPLDEPYWGYWW